jgi:hypothetical protein
MLTMLALPLAVIAGAGPRSGCTARGCSLPAPRQMPCLPIVEPMVAVTMMKPVLDSYLVLIAGAAAGAGLPGDQPYGATSGAAPGRAGSAGASWLRELMPSLVKTFRRW